MQVLPPLALTATIRGKAPVGWTSKILACTPMSNRGSGWIHPSELVRVYFTNDSAELAMREAFQAKEPTTNTWVDATLNDDNDVNDQTSPMSNVLCSRLSRLSNATRLPASSGCS
jgi:hypothetical protein